MAAFRGHIPLRGVPCSINSLHKTKDYHQQKLCYGYGAKAPYLLLSIPNTFFLEILESRADYGADATYPKQAKLVQNVSHQTFSLLSFFR